MGSWIHTKHSPHKAGNLKTVEKTQKVKVEMKNYAHLLISLSGLPMSLILWSSRWKLSISSNVSHGFVASKEFTHASTTFQGFFLLINAQKRLNSSTTLWKRAFT